MAHGMCGDVVFVQDGGRRVERVVRADDADVRQWRSSQVWLRVRRDGEEWRLAA